MRKILRKFKNKKGFTLAEILVGIALIAIIVPMTYKLYTLGNDLIAKSYSMVDKSNSASFAIKSDNNSIKNINDYDSNTNITGVINIDSDITVMQEQRVVTYKIRKSSDGTIEYISYE